MKRSLSLTTTAVLLTILSAISVSAQEVGKFAVVQNNVTSLKPGTAAPVPAVPGLTVVLDELEATAAASSAKLTFGEGAVISLGQSTEFRVTRQTVDAATGVSTSTVDLLLGKARVFVSRLWGGRPEVNVETPTAVVGIKGSEVVVEVDRDGRTVVTVLSGSAVVSLKGATGGGVSLTASESATVEAGGRKVDGPATVGAKVLAELREATEPTPTTYARGDLVGLPLQPAPAPPRSDEDYTRIVLSTQALSSGGTTMNQPALTTTREPH